mmetsp:Transcript_17995/g.31489  ORF Transcript_17995/g.31489 Transcript_17995/m.31489 type:complete len:352 (+) Transcript_17995:60-1115(+)
MGGNTSLLASTQWWFHAKNKWTAPGFKEASKNFNEKDLAVDLKDKVFMITGANSGLGFSMAKTLAKKNATVIMLCRNKERGTKARDEIIKETDNKNVRLEILDVSRPQQIKSFAENYVQSKGRLDALVNNAGALFQKRKDTPEGFETTFAVHSLGAYLLTEYLMPSLAATEPAGRVINMTSGGLYTVKMDAKHFQSPKKEFKGDGLNSDGALVYSQCKRHQLYMTKALAKKYADVNKVKFHVTHPGWAKTAGTEEALPEWFNNMDLRTPEQGADTAVWLAVAQSGPPAESSGEFWFDREKAHGDFGGFLANTASSQADIDKLMAYLHQCKVEAENMKPANIDDDNVSVESQ